YVQLARETSLEAVHGLERLALELEHAQSVRKEELPRPRHLRPPPEPIEQAHAELLLEGADVLGDRRLSQPQRLGGLGEGLELGHLREDLELPQINGAKYRRDAVRCLHGERTQGPAGPCAR